jgi:hypothetical protein
VPLNAFPSTTGSYWDMHPHLTIYNPWSGMAQDSMLSLFHIFSIIILCRCFVLILSVGPLRSLEGWQVAGRKMNSYRKVSTVFWDMTPVSLADSWWIMDVGTVNHTCTHEHSHKPTQAHNNSSRPHIAICFHVLFHWFPMHYLRTDRWNFQRNTRYFPSLDIISTYNHPLDHT